MTSPSRSASTPGVRTLRMKPLRVRSLPAPSTTPSGMFPAVPVQPSTVARADRRLRRAVLLMVVLGAVGLFTYASMQHAAHARVAAPVSAPAR